MRALPFALALLTLVACDKTRVVSPQDAGPVCEATETLVNGECRFVCRRDGDCPSGQRCDLLIGSCVARPPDVDAGQTARCTEGAVRCSTDGAALERCNAAGAFVVAEQCVQPEGYCQDERCLRCRPGASRCAANGTQVELCVDDGSDYRTVTCAPGASCTTNACTVCVEGATRCTADGKNFEECQRTGDDSRSTDWVPAGDSFDGSCITQVCETVAGAAQCRPPVCLPGSSRCASTTTQQVCSATGAYTDVTCTQVPGLGATAECVNGTCVDECGEARNAKSYFGCEYWTTVMDNTTTASVFRGNQTTAGQGTTDSEFAFVVANTSTSVTTVTISRFRNNAVEIVKTVQVPGRNDPATRGVAQIKVPWHAMGTLSSEVGLTGRARYAYRLTSNHPVTAYQFNPLSAVGTRGTCTSDAQCTLQPSALEPRCVNNVCNYYSYSNDASLLLPAHILGTSYVALTPEHIVARNDSNSGAPSNAFNGTLSVVATQDGTVVTVRAAARTLAGGSVAALAAGATQTFTLNAFEVLQLSSDMPATTVNGSTAGNLACVDSPYNSPFCGVLSPCQKFCRVSGGDLTGTIVTSDKPIAMFGGSACTLRGYTDSACDHVEEQLFPFVTWGKNFVAARSAPLRLTSGSFASPANAGPDYYKIVAGCPDSACPNGTLITLSAPPAAGDVLSNAGGCEAGTSLTANTCRLRGGRFVEFRSKTSFSVTADQPIQVAQMFAGQNATTGADRPVQGDPSLVLLPPIEQWRASYTVLTAPGTRDNYLGIVFDDARVLEVRVDGTLITGASAIGGGTFKQANVPVATGSHTIQVLPRANQQTIPGAGVTVYGFDEYVSYGYTGGLDLTTIVTGVNPGG